MMNQSTIRFAFTTVLALLLASVAHGYQGRDFSEQMGNGNRIPDAAKDIGVDSKLGDFLDPDATFHDEENNFVRLGDFFDGKRPIILSFNYSNCPKLCEVQLEHMTDTLRDVDFSVGEEYQIISISIDPKEQYSRARDMRDTYLQQYNWEAFDRPDCTDDWHFLIGDQDTIKYVADQCGVRYKYIQRQKLYSHPPVFLLISPKGKIVRYIHGISYEASTVSRALIEAAEGKIGSPINRLSFVTGCFLFDETTGKYSLSAIFLMRVAGVFTVFCIIVSVVPYWWFKKNKTTSQKEKAPNEADLANNPFSPDEL